ncbi:MAG: sigma-54 dependent transcriptional regulator [Gammaproteobacteria bacterium]
MNTFEQTLYGEAPDLKTVLRAASIVAATDVTTLILGESGTGKELLARGIHAESPRANGPFVSLNCASLPEGLAESLLFGHCKGAFSGADGEHAGHIRSAAGGTLFLDEVGELPLAIQAKLLRFLESGECQPVGSNRAEEVNVRIIAATNRDLHAEMQAGRFREDLYYRLHVVPLEIPPLRQRGSDVLLLLDRLTADLAAHHGLEAPQYSKTARAALAQYDWPGNVRELRNLCERMLVLFGGKRVEPDNLPHELRIHHRKAGAAGFVLPAGGISLAELEIDMIRQALTQSRGNRSRAARLLGLSRDTLLYRMKKYAIEA